MVAPEYKWNDYAGLDVKGKVVIVMVNDPGFVSGDYYPLIPFVFMYLTGFFAAQAAQASSLEAPAWAYANPIPELAVLGRHALPFYLLHQPVILGVLELVYSVR